MHSIRLIRPAPLLRDHVRFYAQRTSRIQDGEVVHPITARATPLLEFIFGDRIAVVERERGLWQFSPSSVVVGAQTCCRADLRLRGAIDCFVIMFQPTGLHRLFSIPMNELTDRNYDAHSVLGKFASHIEQRLGDCQTMEQRVRVADQFLLERHLCCGDLDGTSAAARRMLLHGGRVQISALARDVNLSLRQLERSFISQVGMRPKLYARIARFEAALDGKARSSNKSWTDVAHEFGYYDQMHMVHDFEDLTGMTPTHTLGTLQALFPERAKAQHPQGPLRYSDDQRLIL